MCESGYSRFQRGFLHGVLPDAGWEYSPESRRHVQDEFAAAALRARLHGGVFEQPEDAELDRLPYRSPILYIRPKASILRITVPFRQYLRQWLQPICPILSMSIVIR